MSAELTFRKRSLKILLDQLEAQKLITKEQRKNLEDGENAKASLEDRFSKAAEYATGIANSLGSMTESLERVFGMSTGLKETLQIIQGVGMGLGDMLSGAAGIMSGDPLKMIQGGMQAISGFANIIGSFNKAHDERREKSIQRELKLVENLTRLYEKLGKEIETAYSVDTFQDANKQAQQNLEAQIEARERMIQSEKDKKETDWERINEWNNEIEELLEEAEKLEQERLSNLGGVGGEAGYKDAAQGFMDAWLDAFMETGHGLDALEDEFDTFLKNIVAKQLMLKATDSFLAPLFKTIDEAVYDADVTRDEMQKIREEAEKTLPNLDEFLKQLAADLGMSDMAGVKGELGGLQAGIQGITAEQSDILASYLNSIRFFVADSNTQLKALVAAQGIDTDAPNPMLSQLINIAESVRQNAATTDAINDLLNRVKLSTNDGTALKVRMV